MIHQALGNGPANATGATTKLLEGMKTLKQAQMVQPAVAKSPTSASSLKKASVELPSETQQAVMQRV